MNRSSLAARLPFARAAALLVALAGAPFAAVADVPSGQPVDGIECQAMEGAVFHIHQHLALFDHGRAVPIPADIGQSVTQQCLYWIHTHTPDGIVHVESPKYRSFTLGELFDIWGEPLTSTAVGPARIRKGQLKAYVGGVLYRGDPRTIQLAQRSDITLEAGPPYGKPVPFTDWGAN